MAKKKAAKKSGARKAIPRKAMKNVRGGIDIESFHWGVSGPPKKTTVGP